MSLDLSGLHFTQGIDYHFPEGSMLAPGAYYLLVRNIDAFAVRYGAGIAVDGVFENGTRLDNAGERIKLERGL